MVKFRRPTPSSTLSVSGCADVWRNHVQSKKHVSISLHPPCWTPLDPAPKEHKRRHSVFTAAIHRQTARSEQFSALNGCTTCRKTPKLQMNSKNSRRDSVTPFSYYGSDDDPSGSSSNNSSCSDSSRDVPTEEKNEVDIRSIILRFNAYLQARGQPGATTVSQDRRRFFSGRSRPKYRSVCWCCCCAISFFFFFLNFKACLQSSQWTVIVLYS